MRALLPRLPLLVIPAALFLALFHPATLDIGNPGWLIRGTDNGENALGFHAYRHDAGAGASLSTGLLNAPDGVALLFTDSNPALSLVGKALAPFLPRDAQLIGPWLLLCLFLQTLFAWALLRPHLRGALGLWCGVVLLAAMPTLINRFVHVNLMAHWLILWALWLFVDPVRRRDPRWWAALIACATMIHSYLLVMVASIWASSLLARFFAHGWRTPIRDRLEVISEGVAILLITAGLARWLGVGGDHALTGSYGAFAMPLDALWNPANPAYSTLLPATPQREGRGFEGFQYLGAGLLGLIVIAVVVACRHRPAPAEAHARSAARWLLPAFAVLTLIAVSNFPDFAGQRLPRFALPDALAPALDMVRASGRMFWPVAYAIALFAILAVARLDPRRAGLMLVTALVVQIADLSAMVAIVRAQSAEAGERRLFVRTLDPRWDAAIAGARDVAMVPADPTRDLQLFQEVAWRAARAGVPVRSVYAARTPVDTAQRMAAEDRAFFAGRMAPGRLYVVVPGTPIPRSISALAERLDGVTILRSHPIETSRAPNSRL